MADRFTTEEAERMFTGFDELPDFTLDDSTEAGERRNARDRNARC